MESKCIVQEDQAQLINTCTKLFNKHIQKKKSYESEKLTEKLSITFEQIYSNKAIMTNQDWAIKCKNRK